MYMANWMTPGRQGHVALVLDLEMKQVTCGALMPDKFELFDTAHFDEMLENGEGALYHVPSKV